MTSGLAGVTWFLWFRPLFNVGALVMVFDCRFELMSCREFSVRSSYSAFGVSSNGRSPNAL